MAERPRRINVAVNTDTTDALQLLMDREGVTLTEAVRRLIGIGEFVYRATKVDGGDVVVHGPDGNRKLELL